MPVRLRRNRIPAVRAAISQEIKGALDDMAEDLTNALEDRVWKDTGVLQGTVDTIERWEHHAKIAIGFYLGHGFYSGFQEQGTVKQAARPVVVPTAHESEPIFASYVEKALKRACNR